MITKYGFAIDETVLSSSKKRLINQLWKLIPMREKEENWQKQLNSVIIEVSGLNEIFLNQLNFLTLLSKLEGISAADDFMDYRRTIFESISLLDELYEQF